MVPDVNIKKNLLYNLWATPVAKWTCSKEKQVAAMEEMRVTSLTVDG